MPTWWGRGDREGQGLYSNRKSKAFKQKKIVKRSPKTELKGRLATPRIRKCYTPIRNKRAQFWHKNIHTDQWKIISQGKKQCYKKKVSIWKRKVEQARFQAF